MRAFFGFLCTILILLAFWKLARGWQKTWDQMREDEKPPLLIDQYPLK